MRRFFALVQNELIKIAARPSSRWMLLALAVLSAAYVGFWKLSVVNQSSGYFGMDLQAQIDYYETEQPEGFLAETERLRVLRENEIDPLQPSWRLDAAGAVSDAVRVREKLKRSWQPENAARVAELDASIAEDKRLIAANDWAAYFEKKLGEVHANGELSSETRDNLLWQYQYVLDYDVAADGCEWKYGLFSEVMNAKRELSDEKKQEEQGIGVNRERTRRLEDSILVNCYRIERERKVVANDSASSLPLVNFQGGFGSILYFTGEDGYWSAFSFTAGLVPFLSVLLIVLAGGLISSEFSSGTSRLLLIHPVRRGKLLLAKVAAIGISSLLLLAAFFVWSGLLAGIFNGFSQIGANSIYASNGAAWEISGFLAMAGSYLACLPGLLAYALLAVCLSALSRNTAVSVGVSAALLLGGTGVTNALRSLNQDWARYLLFANVDLAAVRQGTGTFYGQNIGSSLLILLCYMALFLLTAWDSFTRRDAA